MIRLSGELHWISECVWTCVCEHAKWTNVFCWVLAPSGIHRDTQTAPPEVQHTHTHAYTHTHKHTPTFLYLCIFSSFLSVFLSFLFVSRSFSHAVASGWRTTTDGLNWNTHTCTHTHTLKHTHTQELQASQLSACCCLSEAESWSLFQSVGPFSSFGAVWKNLALIFNTVRKTIFFRPQWLHKVSSQNKRQQ